MRESLRFHLQRDEDETGISGTGIVAYGVQFPDGTCVLRWDTAVNSTTFYASINDGEYLHGHGGRTRIVWDDVPSTKLARRREAQPEPYPHSQCPYEDEQGRRCQWDEHVGNVHNITGIPGTPMVPTAIK